MQGPWFFLAQIPVIAVSVGVVIHSIGSAVGRMQRSRAMALPPAEPDPRVVLMQAEIDDLRTQVHRLHAAQAFYAQLNAGAALADDALPARAAAPLS